ncbi:MAG TPA: cytochrome P450 [Puia sp.]|jgi:cytochrome P450|nr:cytochrome P450 [Puia sp.]
MHLEKKTYHLPKGLSQFQTIARSFRSSRHPIHSISENMERFSGTYSAALPGNLKFILTQDPGLINYVLRENHTNYQKSPLTSVRGARIFGNGLLFSNGDYWLRQRRLIQPSFHHKKLQGLYEIIVKSIVEFLSSFPEGGQADVYPLMHQLAFNIVVRSLFDIELSVVQMSDLNRIFNELQNFYMSDINLPVRRILYPFTREDRLNYRKSAKLRAIILDIIQERRSDPGEYHDLLDLLLNARYEDNGLPMTEDQVIDEVLILLFAGHETTATTLSWLLYQVASQKDVQEKIGISIQQIDVYDSIRNVYLQAVINESMRLRPAAWITDRVALADDMFGDLSFPKNTIIMPFFYGMHRNKDYWNDANSFIPERFIDEQGKIKKHISFFPFGAGPRLCIGNNFAMAEISLFMYAFFKQFRILPTEQVPEMKALITLRPDKVILGIEKLK